ncbi:alkaline phosphatase family protein [Paenibacillus sp. N1-5-1-14]|uniref:alkaline phosphatase family protein n=1 Tax=Paenibacillus radicibacter TaxID=2972488 RepID=UPI002158BD14|nr:alkaline phosphatase family protein [Paenibacillus radicibacter]MCR8643732.1 alkaline phosphatase family protein [Paenibacillus radicibacter]
MGVQINPVEGMRVMKQKVERVFIFGMDGAGIFVKDTPTPYLDQLASRGAITYDAQAVMPSISAQCWGSMLHGVPAEKHGLTNNIAGQEKYPLNSPYPSIFKITREAFPDAKMASFTTWRPINNGIIEDGLDIHKDSSPDADNTEAICTYIDQNPDVKLLFVQLDDPDISGHKHGFGAHSEGYLEAITRSDRYIGMMLEALERNYLVEKSLIILVTDHGGGGVRTHDHGSDHPHDMTVFWAVSGPGIEAGTVLTELSIMDTAAVVAHALGLEAPVTWEGKVPQGLFK